MAKRSAPRRRSQGGGSPHQVPLAPAAGFVAEADPAPYPVFPYYDVLDKWQWAVEARIKNGPAKLVLMVLAFHANKRDGVAWPSRDTLAAKTGLTATTIKRALRTLENCGWLVRAHRLGQTTRYRPKAPMEEVCSGCLGSDWCSCDEEDLL